MAVFLFPADGMDGRGAASGPVRSAGDLQAILRRIDGAGYGAYRDMEGAFDFPGGEIDQDTYDNSGWSSLSTTPWPSRQHPALPAVHRSRAVRPLRPALPHAGRHPGYVPRGGMPFIDRA